MKPSKKNTPTPPPAASDDLPLVFGKANYLIMLVGALLMVAGYLAMTGGGSSDPNVFPREEIYSFRRITLGPILVLLGLALQVPAIFYKAKD